MKKARSQARSRKRQDASNSRTRARSFWTKSATSLSNYKRNCCAFCRSRSLKDWGATALIRWTSGSSPRRTAIWPGMVKQGTFREDLYYRLKVFPIHIPALRQRTEDIPELVRHFLALYSRRMNKTIDKIPSETMDALVRYRWPGNIRELQNFIERAVILSPQSVLRAPVAELEPFQAKRGAEVAISGLAEVERDHIVRALEASDWVVGGRNGAAARLGMKRTSLVYRMQKLGISRQQAPGGENPRKGGASRG